MVELQFNRIYARMHISMLWQKIVDAFHAFRSDRVLSLSVLLAVALHLIFIFAVTFVSLDENATTMQDIALAVTESKDKNPDADYLAQTNQQGSGVLRSTHRLTSPLQNQNQNQEVHEQNVTITMIEQKEQPLEASQAGERTLTSTASWKASAQAEKNNQARKLRKQHAQQAAAASMIATLEAQYANKKQEYSRSTNVHTVDSVSTHSDPSAQYLNQFRRKVEKIGNRNYPAEARRLALKGDVRLMVILLPDGTIRAIRLLKSSGSHLLDNTAKNSVRHGAPYGHFDKKMKDYSELRIIRTWRFSDENELDIGTE
ncbi:MAG: energy transducer TonB [Candidatus Saccharibacteria bacterium]|nr:energy transducer TonB [Moraxellaceae bacterium]